MGHCEAVRLLCIAGVALNNKNRDSNTALMLAASREYLEIVRLLVDFKADVNFKDNHLRNSAAMMAIAESHWEIVHVLEAAGSSLEEFDKLGNRPLNCAAREGKIYAVEWLPHNGADIDGLTFDQCWTALRESVVWEHVSILRLLVERGACTEIRDRRGFTALHYAAAPRRVKQAQILLEAGANC